MRQRLIIGLAGSVGAGKGTAAAYLERRYGAAVFRFSDPFRAILKTLYVDDTRSNLQLISTLLRQTYGQDVLSVIAKKNIEASDRRIVVIDGARRISDLDGIASDPNFRLLFIDADVRVRYDRIVLRAQNWGDNEKTYEDFLKEERGETEISIRTLRDIANAVVHNDTGETEFYAAIDAFVAEGLSEASP